MLKSTSLIWLVLLSLFLAGCAGTQNRQTDPQNDPWEGFNRKVYAFNDGLDKVVRPVAVGYDKIMPDPFQRGVGNFFRNLDTPVTFVNQVLQGKLRQSGSSIGRFLLNSTVGLLGFFDVATKVGMPYYNEDLGQTLAKWGYEDSRYLMLPFFGPSTFRDGTGRRYLFSAHRPSGMEQAVLRIVTSTPWAGQFMATTSGAYGFSGVSIRGLAFSTRTPSLNRRTIHMC
jgi:phospholipid-binding lipoprotein MlaA